MLDMTDRGGVSSGNATMNDDTAKPYVQLTSDIVCAYVSNNSVPTGDLAKLISETFSSITALASGQTTAKAQEMRAPAVNPKKSVFDDHIVCLEDGKKFKTLKRHLRTTYNLSPEQYRAKWGLAPDYPMVAPAYAQARSNLARSMGLGRRAGESPAKGTGRGRGRRKATQTHQAEAA